MSAEPDARIERVNPSLLILNQKAGTSPVLTAKTEATPPADLAI
jgi:hypothetical protein